MRKSGRRTDRLLEISTVPSIRPVPRRASAAYAAARTGREEAGAAVREAIGPLLAATSTASDARRGTGASRRSAGGSTILKTGLVHRASATETTVAGAQIPRGPTVRRSGAHHGPACTLARGQRLFVVAPGPRRPVFAFFAVVVLVVEVYELVVEVVEVILILVVIVVVVVLVIIIFVVVVVVVVEVIVVEVIILVVEVDVVVIQIVVLVVDIVVVDRLVVEAVIV